MSGRQFLSKLTTQSIIAFAVVGTASALAILGQIDGPSYLGLAIAVVGFYYRTADAGKE